MARILFNLSIFVVLFVQGALFATHFSLKETLSQAQPGSFMLIAQGKTLTFLRIADKNDSTVMLEEISIANERFETQRTDTRTWYLQGAPNHNSWMQSQIDLTTGTLQTYSHTHGGWLAESSVNALFATLLNLSFEEVPLCERRRIGPAPGYGKEDHRPLWHPRLIIDGQNHPYIPFTAYTAIWPSDGSDLENKRIEIYLPQVLTYETDEVSTYPLFFPYFLVVEGKVSCTRVRSIDAGCGLFRDCF